MSEAVLTLVNKGAEVNSVNKERRTALHIAVVNRNIDLVSTLLKVGADVNIQDVHGDSPFHLALLHGDHALISLLIDGAAFLSCNAKGHNSLHIAAIRGDVLAIKKILKKDRTIINIVTRDGDAAVHLSVHCPSSVLALTSCAQCDVNIGDSRASTVLHKAAARLDVSLVKQLVEVGASVQSQDMLGNTPAHSVLLEGRELGPYSNQLEGLLDRQVLDMMSALHLNQLETVQTGLVLYLLKQGGGNVANYHNQTVLDLMENAEAKKFVHEMSMRSADCQSEHEYAEIVEVIEDGAAALEGPPECIVCSEVVPLVTFLPCTHQVACMDCSIRVKKCLKCGLLVQEKKFDATGEEANKERERLKSLEMKVQDLEDQFLCSICLERRRNVAFKCGHGACDFCSRGLDTCHMCRKVIEEKILLY
jgi:E3 ubiquitin-protein ligase mind-bomb